MSVTVVGVTTLLDQVQAYFEKKISNPDLKFQPKMSFNRVLSELKKMNDNFVQKRMGFKILCSKITPTFCQWQIAKVIRSRLVTLPLGINGPPGPGLTNSNWSEIFKILLVLVRSDFQNYKLHGIFHEKNCLRHKS